MDEQIAKRIVSDIKDLPGFPEDRWRVSKLVDAILKHCKSEEHARRVIDAHLEASRFCPAPAEIARLAAETPADNVQAQRTSRCPLCEGHRGYQLVHILRTCESTPWGVTVRNERITPEQYVDLLPRVGYQIRRQYVIEAAEPCECRR